ncbi:MAG TPA: sigma-70 family RNA polymerase sigma factor [Gemmataceae bacterium]|jgi:RNA polymerase sigma factor (sigma-70 family)|nr:sigma-70 family RNA polymerase sigma factor [Gemmataceae bacterium]
MSDPAVMHGVLRHLRRTERRRLYHLLGDRELLGRFLADRDEVAFEEVVTRHGPMVRAVCRRILGPTTDADDAFQAAFLVLIRKARSIRKGDLLGGWLCAVAYRAARQALRRRSRIAARERPTDNMPEPIRVDDPPLDWLPLFDAALQRLPAKYRDPVVLCELQGISRRDASARLGLTEGTLSSRLGRARDLLRRKLGRHGFPLALGSTLAPVVVPEALTASTAAAAMHTSAASVSAIVLTEGVLAAMFAAKLKAGALAGTAVLLLGVVVSLQIPGPASGAGEQPGKDGPAAKETPKTLPKDAPVVPAKPARVAPDYEKFQGKWLVATASDGTRVGVSAFEIDYEWKFAGTALSTGGEIKEDAAEEFTLNAKTTPPTIDFTLTQFDPSKTGRLNRQSLQGIYRFEPDGTLTIAFRTKAEGIARPTRFATAVNAGVTIVTLERDEPARKEPPAATPRFDSIEPIGPPPTPPTTAASTNAVPLDPAKSADLGKVVGAWELADVDGRPVETAIANLAKSAAKPQRWATLRRLQLLPATGPTDLVNAPGNSSYVAYADLDSTRSPKWFTLHSAETKQATGPGGAGYSTSAVRLCGIYKLDGEKLVLCLPELEGSPLLRPTDFKGDGEGGVYLLTFQRAAKMWKPDAPPQPTPPMPVGDVLPPAIAADPGPLVPPTAVTLPPMPLVGPAGPPVIPAATAPDLRPAPALIPDPPRQSIPEDRGNTTGKETADSDVRPPVAAQSDLDRLQGTWVLTQLDGKPVQPGQKPETTEFVKDRVLTSDGSHGRVRIDETKSPRQMSMTMAKPEDNPMVGIYKFEGDRLFIACSTKTVKLIPVDFEADDDVRVAVYERPKMAAPPPPSTPRIEPATKVPMQRDLQKEIDQLREQLKRLEQELKDRK